MEEKIVLMGQMKTVRQDNAQLKVSSANRQGDAFPRPHGVMELKIVQKVRNSHLQQYRKLLLTTTLKVLFFS